VARHPVRLRVADDLTRSRLTVFFRLPLTIPHFVWLVLWGIAAFFAAVGNWFATLFTGRPPAGLHRFLSRYVRYVVHVYAFLYLAADPFPGFTGRPGSYPVDVEIDAPARQSRAVTFFRLFLALPALALSGAITGGFSFSYRRSRRGTTAATGAGLVQAAAVFGWFVSMARARMPRGLRDAGAWGIGYGAQAQAYLFLLTDRYPNSDPVAMLEGAETPEHPLRIRVTDDRSRSRLTVFFRLFVWLPHAVWLYLWGILAQLAVVANWFIALFGGSPSAEIHRFVGSYLRYATHAWSYLLLIADPFPGFTGKSGSYPVDLEIAPPARQSRWITGFRLFLSIPAFFLTFAYGGVVAVAAFGGWFACLATGRMPHGLRNAGAAGVRYIAQTHGYLYLLTDRYPYTGPTGVEGPPQAEPEPEWTAPERPIAE
jgi:Domain of unknown function (DUF4389)